MAAEVILPKVDMDMIGGTISKWHVGEGESVQEGQRLFEIETDKATMEIEAQATGIVAHLAPSGIRIPVGFGIAKIFKHDEPIPPFVPYDIPEVPLVCDITKRRPMAAPPPVPTGTVSTDGVRATPLARKLARERHVSLEQVAGNGPRGRIIAADVPALTTTTLPPNATRVNIDAMRRTIAGRLSLSKQTVPHFYVSVTCDVAALLDLRQQLNEASTQMALASTAAADHWKLSINDFVIKALALSLMKVPEANVSWQDDHILKYNTADIAVAVAVEGGVFTPVLHGAEKSSLSEIARSTKDFASRARLHQLSPHEYQGGSSSVSNLGMFGIEEFTAILSPPQATILAVGAAIEQYVPVNGQPTLHPLMKCTLSCDHRVIDGHVGAMLLSTFKDLMENPHQLLS